MKTLAKLVVIVFVLVIALPIVRYRTASPCGMLKKELVDQAKSKAESAVEQGREAASEYGDRAERIAAQVGEMVENVTEEVAAGVAELRVEDMSTGECVKELWRIKAGGDSDGR
jgi:hypothetical protein